MDQHKVNRIMDGHLLHEYRTKAANRLGLATAELTAKLADDREYRMLVRNAYNHLVAKGRGGDLSFVEMHAALAKIDIFVNRGLFKAVASDKAIIDEAHTSAKRDAMTRVAVLPLLMAACYLGLILYFRARGGYKTVELTAEGEES